jgi:hypothetical protein
VPRNPMDSRGIRPYTSGQEKVLRTTEEGGVIRNVPHSVARALRDRNLGDIVSKEGGAFPNGHRPMTRGFPTVTFRLNGLGRTEAARLLLAVGDCEAAENVQVAPLPGGNK